MKFDLTPTPKPITPPADLSVDIRAFHRTTLAQSPYVEIHFLQKGNVALSFRVTPETARALAAAIHRASEGIDV